MGTKAGLLPLAALHGRGLGSAVTAAKEESRLQQEAGRTTVHQRGATPGLSLSHPTRVAQAGSQSLHAHLQIIQDANVFHLVRKGTESLHAAFRVVKENFASKLPYNLSKQKVLPKCIDLDYFSD